MAKGKSLPVEDSYGIIGMTAAFALSSSSLETIMYVSTCPKIRQWLSSVINLIQRSVPGRVSHQRVVYVRKDLRARELGVLANRFLDGIQKVLL